MDVVQWDIIVFCEEFWKTNSIFPLRDEIVKGVNVNATTVDHWLNQDLTKKHLSARGIDFNKSMLTRKEKAGPPPRRSNRLTDKQMAVVATVLNPADNRSLGAKLQSLGVSPATYNGWKKNTHFMDFMTKQSEALYGEYMPEVANSLVKNAVGGNFQSQKFLYEVTGRYRGAQTEDVANVKFLVIRLIETIQKHVKDPLVIQAIAEEIKQITAAQDTANGMLEPKPINQAGNQNMAGLASGEVIW